MLPLALADTSFVYALYNADDPYHRVALSAMRRHQHRILVPMVVLPEVASLYKRDFRNIYAVAQFMDRISDAQPQLEPLLYPDLRRAAAIMRQYAAHRLDFVDCCLVAIAERLDVPAVYTFDETDFRRFSPAHRPYFDVLP